MNQTTLAYAPLTVSQVRGGFLPRHGRAPTGPAGGLAYE